jgi:hypothetical protein
VYDIEFTQGFHRFRNIEPLDWSIEPLDIAPWRYALAQKKADKAYKDAIDFKQDPETF